LFKRLLTGQLDAAVPSYPPFKGTEKNLLRAQIARIVVATSISPDGFFPLNEDDPPSAVPAEGMLL
jgi:radial spoke head protein 4A